MRWATVMLELVLVLVAAPAWADVQAGVDAYEKGDYATALKEWRPLAAQGNAAAQALLGMMYEEGQGVPKDYVQAYMWLSLAAAQGYEPARKARVKKLAKKMTLAQLDEAQWLAREWKPNP